MDYSLPGEDEFVSRWDKTKKELESNNVDIFFAYANDRAVHGAGHVRYFSDFPAHFEDVAVLIPREGDPVLLTGPESKEYAQLVSFVKDIRVIEEFAMPDEEYPFTKMVSISDLINEMNERTNERIKRVGVIGMDLIPHLTFERIKQSLGHKIEIIDATEICYRLRSRKSEWEQKIIRRGYELAGMALDRVFNIIKPGIKEYEVAVEIEKILRSHGSEGNAVDTIVSFGKSHTHPIVNRPTANHLQENDFGVLTFGPRFHGYNPAIGRPFFIGKVPDEVLDGAKAALEAQLECQQFLKPGMIGSEVEAVGRKILKKYGLEQYFVYAGVHSVGLAEFEPPILAPKSNDIVKPGMIFSIDIPIFLAPWGGLRFEDGFLITPGGNEHLSNYYRELVHL
jgi:Xaa-Pro aminopeptidase